MNDADTTVDAIGIVESGDDPNYQQDVVVGGQSDRKLGRYGILQSRWSGLTEAFGYPGGRWHDPALQRQVARRVIEGAYQELGDWTLSSVAFRFGMPVARRLAEAGAVTPADIEAAGYTDIGQYVRALHRSEPAVRMRVSGRHPTTAKPQTVAPARKRSEDILRQRLIGMRNVERNRLANAKPTEGEVSDGLDVAGS